MGTSKNRPIASCASGPYKPQQYFSHHENDCICHFSRCPYSVHGRSQLMNSSFPGHVDPIDDDGLDDYSEQSRAPSVFDAGIVDYLYLIESNLGGLCKIGITSDPDRRMRELQPRQILALVEVTNARSVEKNLHIEYAHARLAGTEYFELGEAEIAEIISTIEFGSAAADTSFRIVPTTVKQGIEFAIEYQKRHSNFWEICAKRAIYEVHRNLDPMDAAKLELHAQEAFEELQEYIDACWSFRGFAYDGPIEGVLKASQLICAYHQYRIDKGIDELGDDLEPREWNENLMRVQDWKRAGLSPSEMMKRSHDIDYQMSKETLAQINKSISDQSVDIKNTSSVPINTSLRKTEKPRRDTRTNSSDLSIRRANALRRWKKKASD